ncbi:MAG: RNB domain-containing ribonuclease, partial [Treponema sp.]|nr:RNB domain-containing ribonuclease [Treponema sp.]
MIREKSLVVYKNRPALVIETGEKISISVLGGEQVRVREKDIDMIHPGPCALSGLEQDIPSGDARFAWELLEGSPVTLRELAELVYGEYTAKSAWSAYLLLKDRLYFSGELTAIQGRSSEEVILEEQKRAEKRQDREERNAFLERLKSQSLQLPDDGRFLQDVDALGYGKTDKSRTLRDLGKPETPQEAHRLLLNTGFWTPQINPHPARFGLSLFSAKIPVSPPSRDEERLDLTHLHAFAIDNAWSSDPDDAISVEGNHIWVHVADPAAVITPGSPADIEARGRGATLYLPEGAARMIAEEALPFFALGLEETSPALSFKIALNEDLSIEKTEIVRSRVKVTRLTYEEADALIGAGNVLSAGDTQAYIPELTRLHILAERNFERRLNAGAVSIELPEVHIAVSGGQVTVEPLAGHRSADMVRECMLLAGEGAARWALQRRLPFPYISQEIGDIPNVPLDGMAGSFQLRRCMRPRTLSVKPGIHWGLGLDEYTQVTSPLRRYTDLLAHQQIRAFLRNEPPLQEEEVILRLAAGEAAASTVMQAERASRAHWTAVYLSDKKGIPWDGVMLEKRGGRGVVMIPALGLETQAAIKKDLE